MLEGLGIPTVNVVSHAFAALFRLEAKQQGMAGLRYVTLPHPFGGIDEESVDRKARAAVDDLYRALLDKEPA
jgi:hypothetical protein